MRCSTLPQLGRQAFRRELKRRKLHRPASFAAVDERADGGSRITRSDDSHPNSDRSVPMGTHSLGRVL